LFIEDDKVPLGNNAARLVCCHLSRDLRRFSDQLQRP
jgi:hypothetical protein